jgi:hypothetical protein
MKKVIAVLLVFALTAPLAMDAMAEGEGRGGVMGFIAGCCFGIRAGADYNDGKEIHWREWCRLIPCVGLVFAIWDGVDGVNGMTRADYSAKYGAAFY